MLTHRGRTFIFKRAHTHMDREWIKVYMLTDTKRKVSNVNSYEYTERKDANMYARIPSTEKGELFHYLPFSYQIFSIGIMLKRPIHHSFAILLWS